MKIVKCLWCVALVVAALLGPSGCGEKKAEKKRAEPAAAAPAPAAPTSPEENYAVVRTFFATDRKEAGNTAKGIAFGNKRGGVSYGSCDVSIPRGHKAGEMESPSWLRLEFREDPEKHIVMLRAERFGKDRFYEYIYEKVKASGKSNAFIFIHGYNVTFEDAARRTAQMAYDLRFAGPPVFYSWPSQGKLGQYLEDEQNIEWAQANIRTFLEEFLNRSKADNVYLIAHSMGNRGLTRAVAALFEKSPGMRARIREIILAAPDIDAEVFKRDIAPVLTAGGSPVTLYASSKDVALAASKKIHGYPRAGESGDGLVILPGVETIDATEQDTSFLGHAYFAEERPVLADIFELFKGQRANSRFGLRPIDSRAGRYWVFTK